jgi:hypothetical protein
MFPRRIGAFRNSCNECVCVCVCVCTEGGGVLAYKRCKSLATLGTVRPQLTERANNTWETRVCLERTHATKESVTESRSFHKHKKKTDLLIKDWTSDLHFFSICNTSFFPQSRFGIKMASSGKLHWYLKTAELHGVPYKAQPNNHTHTHTHTHYGTKVKPKARPPRCRISQGQPSC